MKKNAMLKIAAILMVAVLLTTCAISSTFAKYVTEGTEGKDSARVAKWGVTIDTAIPNLFVDTYDVNSDDEVIGVSAADVVAPGTEGSVTLDTSVTGTPEVAVRVTTAATVDLSNWEDEDGNFYCPLVFTINTATVKQDDAKNNTADKLEAAIVAEIVKATKEYKAGTDLSAAEDFDLTISWKWDFTGNDEADTWLGNAKVQNGTDAEGNPVYLNPNDPAEVEISITQKVEQIDTFKAGN